MRSPNKAMIRVKDDKKNMTISMEENRSFEKIEETSKKAKKFKTTSVCKKLQPKESAEHASSSQKQQENESINETTINIEDENVNESTNFLNRKESTSTNQNQSNLSCICFPTAYASLKRYVQKCFSILDDNILEKAKHISKTRLTRHEIRIEELEFFSKRIMKYRALGDVKNSTCRNGILFLDFLIFKQIFVPKSSRHALQLIYGNDLNFFIFLMQTVRNYWNLFWKATKASMENSLKNQKFFISP